MKKDKPIEQNQESAQGLDYEKDPRFIEYIKYRLERSRDPVNLIDGRKATQNIRKKIGLPIYE